MRAILSLALFALTLVQGDAEEQLRYMAGLASKGVPSELAREAQSFLREHPGHPRADEARYRLACALFDQHEPQKAAELLRPLSRLRGFEFESEANFRLGQCELDLARPAEAIQALDRAVALGKEYLALPARALRADALLAANRLEDAERAFAEVQERGPQSEYAPDAACGRVWCAFKRKEYDDAIELSGRFLASFARHPRAGEVQFLRAEALFESGRKEPALAAYGKVGAGSYADAALRGAAFALASLGRHEEAARTFETLLQRFPDSRFAAEARLQCGVERLAAGDARGALAALDPEHTGERGEGAYWRARALLASGDRKAALALATRASADERDRALAARWSALRADLLSLEGRHDEARALYETADSDYALQAAAVASLEAKKPEEAVRLARKLLERNPKSPYRIEALLAAAEGLFALGNHEAAEQAFLSASESDADAERRDKTRLRAAWCRYLRKDPARAAAMFQELARTLKDGAPADEAAYMAARASEDAGDLRAARTGYDRYLQRFAKGERRGEALLASARLAEGPDAVERLESALGESGSKEGARDARFELAEKLSKQGSFEPALGHYRKVLESDPPPALAASARYGAAWCLYSLQRYRDASAALEPLLAPPAAGAPAELGDASLELAVWCSVRANDPAAAVRHWRALQARSQNDARVWSAARTLLSALRGKDAAAQRAEVLALAARSAKSPAVAAEIDAERALDALARGERDASLQLLDRAWRGAPGSAGVREAACAIGEATLADGDAESGRQILEALARDERAASADRAVYQLGFASLAAGDARAALSRLARFEKRFPDSPLATPARFLEAEANFRAGNGDRALEQFEALARGELAADLAPKVLFRAGILHCQRERWREGEAELDRLAKQFPKFENAAEAELWRGRAQAARGDAARARATFEALAAADKGLLGAEARLALAELQLAAGEAQAALSAFLRIAVLYSDAELQAQANWGAGRAFEQLGQPEQAAKSYRELLAKAPNSRLASGARERLSSLASR